MDHAYSSAYFEQVHQVTKLVGLQEIRTQYLENSLNAEVVRLYAAVD